MKLLLANGLCGMTPDQGSLVGGMYFIVVGIMQLVFEGSHLCRATEYIAQASLNTTTDSSGNITMSYLLLPRVSFLYYYALLSLQSITLVLVMVMLAGLWFQRARVILAFAVWLVLFDVAMVILISLLQVQMSTVGLMLSPLEWYGFVCRLLGDPFWLSFVITHGLLERSGAGSRRQRGRNMMSTEKTRLKLNFHEQTYAFLSIWWISSALKGSISNICPIFPFFPMTSL
uniref:Uncharacterized protein n=1 Tax=Pygocentrus nattereri TaxID=42514 RepID=A0A3B4CU21_PYGNA